MKTLRDTNNNNSTNQQYLPSTQTTNSSMFPTDPNQLSLFIQNYLSKFGPNPIESINPLLYFQLLNGNTMLMQQQQQYPTVQNEMEKMAAFDGNIFVPKTRPMTQDEIVEHTRTVYRRALQRNQMQQHHDLIKHFYETMNFKGNDASNSYQVPTVPTASNLTSVGTYDVFDTMIESPSSCLSVKETSLNTVHSSSSLQSVDDRKLLTNSSSALDPSAPIFIPRQSQQKSDDDNDSSSSSSSSGSDSNDFHYLDQFLDDFYLANQQTDNHMILSKTTKLPMNQQILGQGDPIEQLTSKKKQDLQYSIYELLDRYRSSRCHLILPEWSRLSLILPNVCSMHGHTYKIKRYFAYRRQLSDNQNHASLQN